MSITDTFTASGLWTCPAGVTSVDAECWGAGGTGGGSTGGGVGGGGGGGAYSKKTGIAVTPGTAYTVTVGAAGTFPGTNTDGADGGDSSFKPNGPVAPDVLAKGGGGGRSTANGSTGGAGGAAASGTGDTKFSGGNGASQTSQPNGGGGGAGSTGAGGTTSTSSGGTGASVGGGTGGAIFSIFAQPAGGGGAGDDFDAGHSYTVGARGEVRITYTAAAGGNFLQMF